MLLSVVRVIITEEALSAWEDSEEVVSINAERALVEDVISSGVLLLPAEEVLVASERVTSVVEPAAVVKFGFDTLGFDEAEAESDSVPEVLGCKPVPDAVLWLSELSSVVEPAISAVVAGSPASVLPNLVLVGSVFV